MIHAVKAVIDWLLLHWRPTGLLALAVGIMTILRSWWESREAKAKARKAERDLLEPPKSSLPIQRTLSTQQRVTLIQNIKDQIRADPPSQNYRFIWVRTFPIEDCQSFTFELTNAIEEAGIHTATGFQGMGRALDNRLYQKGIWIRGNDQQFQPPTEIVLLEAFKKANISAHLVPTDRKIIDLIIGTGE